MKDVRKVRSEMATSLKKLSRLAPEEWSSYLAHIHKRIQRAMREDDIDSMRAIKREISIRTRSLEHGELFDLAQHIIQTVMSLTGLTIVQDDVQDDDEGGQ